MRSLLIFAVIAFKIKKSLSTIETKHDHDYSIEVDEMFDKTSVHKIIFAVKPLNMDILEAVLDRVSFPSSPDYGKHKSRSEVLELIRNNEGRDRVYSYLLSNGAQILEEAPYGAYITASASIESWEMMLST